MFSDEATTIMAEGAEILAEMIRASLMKQEMPPPDIWVWFVKQAALRFIVHEYSSLYANELGIEDLPPEEVQMLADEVASCLLLASQQKQFSVVETVNAMLRTRLLHLPEAYQQSLGKDLLPP